MCRNIQSLIPSCVLYSICPVSGLSMSCVDECTRMFILLALECIVMTNVDGSAFILCLTRVAVNAFLLHWLKRSMRDCDSDSICSAFDKYSPW